MFNKIMKNYIEEFCLKVTAIILNKEAGWSKRLEEEAEKLSQSAKKEAVEESDKEWQIAIGHTCDACYKKIVNRMGQKAKELLK